MDFLPTSKVDYYFYIRTKNSLLGNNECHLEQQFRKSILPGVCVEFKFLKTLISYIQVKCLRAWQTKFKVSKDSKIPGVSGFCSEL